MTTTTLPVLEAQTIATATFPFKPYRSLSNDELQARIAAVRREMGPKLLILGHHYQQDEVIALSDLQGDSYQLSQLAASSRDCRAIVFCGVHFMAETADILANRPERLAERGGQRIPVVLPDMAAGCSMADMAAIDQVENCWDELGEIIDTAEITPVTYINSAANLKAFCGRHGGIVCTSSNAAAVLKWAFEGRGLSPTDRGLSPFSESSEKKGTVPLGASSLLNGKRRVHFFPDQHLGRNTAKAMGIPLDEMSVWDPHDDALGGNTEDAIRRSRVLLWQGHCSVHAMFRPEHVDQFRARFPGIQVLVHPECPMEVVDKSDKSGSTSKIIREVDAAPAGTRWAIGTELHLVNRLKHHHPEQEIHFLSPVVCMCATMYRIDLAHLAWSLENLAAGTPVNVIEVDAETSKWALIALERMLTVK